MQGEKKHLWKCKLMLLFACSRNVCPRFFLPSFWPSLLGGREGGRGGRACLTCIKKKVFRCLRQLWERERAFFFQEGGRRLVEKDEGDKVDFFCLRLCLFFPSVCVYKSGFPNLWYLKLMMIRRRRKKNQSCVIWIPPNKNCSIVSKKDEKKGLSHLSKLRNLSSEKKGVGLGTPARRGKRRSPLSIRAKEREGGREDLTSWLAERGGIKRAKVSHSNFSFFFSLWREEKELTQPTKRS